MLKGYILCRFLAFLMLRNPYGDSTMRLEPGKVIWVASKARWAWRYSEMRAAQDQYHYGLRKIRGLVGVLRLYRSGENRNEHSRNGCSNLNEAGGRNHGPPSLQRHVLMRLKPSVR